MAYQGYQGKCEVFIGEHGAPTEPQCGRPATMRYPAMNGGYMRLCSDHGTKHASHCERWNGAGWTALAAEAEHG